MSDGKFFYRGKVQTLQSELTIPPKKDPKHKKKAIALKKIIANMTMGNDMLPLFSDVVALNAIANVEVKKMVFLYLVNYAKSKPEMAILAINGFIRDISDGNPLIRALALRTMGYIPVDKMVEGFCEPLKGALRDSDPYVVKTACLGVLKLYSCDSRMCEREGLVEEVRGMLSHENANVVANACAVLVEIGGLRVGMSEASRLVVGLNESSEWGQVYILEALMHVVPEDENDAEILAERLIARLSHQNAAIVLSCVKVVVYLTNYIAREDVVHALFGKLGPPLVTLLHSTPELQYVALRNILLIVQKYPPFLYKDISVFFCKYADPIYVKLTKLELLFKLSTPENIDVVLLELQEYAREIDIDFVKRAVRSIGRCAIKIPSASDACMAALVALIDTRVAYVVQEAVIVVKDIFRKYPNRYESIIKTLCENSSFDDPEAKAALIWIIGQYADRIENSPQLLELFFNGINLDSANVALTLLTAAVKLFLKRPTAGQDLMPKVLQWAVENDNPDLRDRAFIYWRLLSTDPVAAKLIVLGEKELVVESDGIDEGVLDELVACIGTLASIYHKPAQTFIGAFRPPVLVPSPCLVVGRRFGPHIVTNNTLGVENPYSDNPQVLADASFDAFGGGKVQESNAFDDFFGKVESDGVAADGLDPLGVLTEFPVSGNPFSGFTQNSPSTPYPPYSPTYSTPVDLIPSENNPFRHSVVTPQPSPFQPSPFTQTNQSPIQPNPSVIIDPFASFRITESLPTLLSSSESNGLQINGKFNKQNGIVLSLQFINKGLVPLLGVDVLFNRNAYSLRVISKSIDVDVGEEKRVDSLVDFGGEYQPSVPINRLQCAVRSDKGLHLFWIQVPFHVLFVPHDFTGFLERWRACTQQVTFTIELDFARLEAFGAGIVGEKDGGVFLSFMMCDGVWIGVQVQGNAVLCKSGVSWVLAEMQGVLEEMMIK